MTETTVPSTIKYIYVEMILNKESNYDVVAGLFKGIYEQDDQKFILLHGLKNATHVVNTEFYNIMMIEERVKNCKNMMFLNADDVDQKTAMQTLEGQYKTLVGAGLVIENDKTLIDIEKYEDVPSDYLKEGAVGKKSSTVSGVGTFANPGTRYTPGTVNNYVKKTQIKPDPEPAKFTRTKTQKPTAEELATFLQKVTQIMAGEYAAILPDELEADADTSVSATDADSFDEDYDIYGADWKGHHCGV